MSDGMGVGVKLRLYVSARWYAYILHLDENERQEILAALQRYNDPQQPSHNPERVGQYEIHFFTDARGNTGVLKIVRH